MKQRTLNIITHCLASLLTISWLLWFANAMYHSNTDLMPKGVIIKKGRVASVFGSNLSSHNKVWSELEDTPYTIYYEKKIGE